MVGENTLGKVVKSIMEKAKIEGFLTYHSLRRSGGTRLFVAGVDRKLVKEMTGHTSDAVDCYQITSEEQKKRMCQIIANTHVEGVGNSKGPDSEEKSEESTVKSNITVMQIEPKEAKSCNCDSKATASNVGDVIEKIVKTSKGMGKTVIEIEIEIHNN